MVSWLALAVALPPVPLWAAGGSDLIDQTSRGIVASPPAETPAPADADAFTVTTVDAAVERDAPEICLMFQKVPDPEQSLESLIELRWEGDQPIPFKVARRGRSLCLSGMSTGGIEHGRRYRLHVSGDLRGVNGRTLGEAIERTVDVPERKPSLAFRDAGFLVTRPGDGLALRSVNVAAAQVRLVRLATDNALERAYFDAGDPTLLERLGNAGGNAKETANPPQEVWSGLIALDTTRNRPVSTALPITAITGKLEPGVYVVQATAAQVGAADASPLKTTQWFVVSDLGLNTVSGPDGVLLFARTLEDTQPAEGVMVRIIGRDRSELAQAVTGPDGLARIDAAQLAGAGERTPQVLLGRRGANVAVVELSGPRVVGGGDPDDNPFQRPRLDAFISADRAVYAPGDTLRGVVLLRDDDGRAESGEPLAVEIRRPDGALSHRLELQDAGGGGYVFSYRLSTAAQPGAWRFTVRTVGTDDAIGETVVRVDDTRPLGLTLTMQAAVERPPASDQPVRLHVRLTVVGKAGRAAGGLSGKVYITPLTATAPYPAFPDYRFGSAEDGRGVVPRDGLRIEAGEFVTAADGSAELRLVLPDRLPLHGAFDARIEAEIAVAGSRAVRSAQVVPYQPRPLAVGLRPRFEGGSVPDGATAAFDVVAVDGASGKPAAVKGLTYELFEEDANFVWYDAQNRWDYRRVVEDRRVAGGQLDVDDGKPGQIAEPVGAGHYRLELHDPASGAGASLHFSAGWWMSPQAGSSPDRVDVVAMRPAGDGKAWVFLRPPYASEVLLVVTDKHTRLAKTQRVGADGTFIEIPTDADWTNGIHILASAFALPDPAYRGPPRRAVGTAWLTNGEQPRSLAVTVTAGATATVTETTTATADGVLPVAVALRPARRGAGGEGADAAATGWTGGGSAVLALFPATAQGQPLGDPAHYFFGERPLPVSVRDAQGGLIAAAGRTAPNLSGEPLRPHSGALWLSPPVAVSETGEAAFQVPLPADAAKDGRYRLVALGWNGDAIGRGETVVTVPPGSGTSVSAMAPVPASWLQRGWSGVLPPATDTPVTIDQPGEAAWLVVEPAANPDLNLGDAAVRGLAGVIPVGTEAAASRLLSLLALGAADADAAAQRFDDLRQRTLDELLALQRVDGAFAAWDPAGPPDAWLTVYAADTLSRLTRAEGQPPGVAVPVVALRAAQGWLAKWWDGSWADPANLPAAAYALALLTADKRLDAGAVGFFNETFAAQLPSEHARALLAAAQSNVGDRRGAEQTMTRVAGGRRVEVTTRDHGSAVRDAAAALLLMVEHNAPSDVVKAMAGRLQRTRATAYSLSEQEAAWLLLAARAGGDKSDRAAADNKTPRPLPTLNPLPVAVPPAGDSGAGENPAPGPSGPGPGPGPVVFSVAAARLAALPWPAVAAGAGGPAFALRNGGVQPLRAEVLKGKADRGGDGGPRVALALREMTGEMVRRPSSVPSPVRDSADSADPAPDPAAVLVAGDAVALTVEADFAPADRGRQMVVSLPLPDGMRLLTALAVMEEPEAGQASGAAEMLRSRLAGNAAVAALRVPAGLARVRLSCLVRFERAGALTIPPARLEPLAGVGRPGAVYGGAGIGGMSYSAPLPVMVENARSEAGRGLRRR